METDVLTDDQAVEAMIVTDDQTEAEATESDDEEPAETDTASEEAEQSDDVPDETTEPEDTAEEAESEGDEDAEEVPTFTVTVDGEEVEVTLDDLTRDFRGNKATTQAMQENARIRKENEALQGELAAQVDHFIRQRDQFLAFVQNTQNSGIAQQPVEPDPAMAETDPIGYMQELAAYNKKAGEWQAQQAEIQRLQSMRAQETEQQQRARVAREFEALKEAIPEFADQASAKEITRALQETGQAYDFTAEELAGITDSRQIRVLNDARKWRALQADTAKAAKKAEKARPYTKPGKSKAEGTRTQHRKLMDKLRSSGSDADALALMMTPNQ